uniref:T cell receptor alpha variable 4 n=1 Tax=Suricata suricatta TaxID=37032 RepID=A0A673TIM8_SURSU
MRQVTRVTVLLLLGSLSLAKTTQPIFIESYEGQEVNISCNHTKIATNEYIYWYRQFPNQGPQFVIQGFKANVANEVASLLISADRTSSTLSLPMAAWRDTAVYYCIVSDTVSQMGLHLCSIPCGVGVTAQGKPQRSAF